MHRDEYNIIGQIQPNGTVEGGDSTCWMGHWAYLTNDPFPYIKTFEVSFGCYVRHPYPEQTNNGFGAYYKNPWNGCISRDQLTGILLAIIRKQDKSAMLRVIAHHSLSLFLFSYNTIHNGVDPKKAKWKLPDLTLFDIWAMELRGFGKFSWIFWPILCLLDIHLLFSWIYDKYFDNQESDCINAIGKLLVSREFIPTPTSWLAAKFINKQNLTSRLKEYWCGWRDNPEFVLAFQQKIDEIL